MSKDEMSFDLSQSNDRNPAIMKDSRKLYLLSYTVFGCTFIFLLLQSLGGNFFTRFIFSFAGYLTGLHMFMLAQKVELRESYEKYLNLPLEMEVLIRNAWGNDWIATVYVDRCTGRLLAPTDPKKRRLIIATSQHKENDMFGAPYWQVRNNTLWMLGTPLQELHLIL